MNKHNQILQALTFISFKLIILPVLSIHFLYHFHL